MKLSANTLGIVIFTAAATTAFIWMAKRQPIETATAMQFGMPLQTSATQNKDTPKLIDEKPSAEESANPDTTTVDSDTSDKKAKNSQVSTDANETKSDKNQESK